MIFGQSGGGGKVSTLMAMPAAKGLIHRASIQSGSSLSGLSREKARENTDKFLAALGLKPNQLDDLQTLPPAKLLSAMTAARVSFSPVVDGNVLPRDPFSPTAPELSADVPLLVGTTETEGTYDVPELVEMDEATLHARLKGPRYLGDDADRIIELFRKKRPRATPAELYFTICATPLNANKQAERKAAQNKAAAYLWQINWRSPVRDGLFMSPHCLELPFVFNNVRHLPEMVGTGPEIQPLADKLSAAWVAFARTGNPNHPGIPNWPAFNPTQRGVMVIDNEWKVVNDLNREERLAMEKFPNIPFLGT
jgi:para-nitrobenzyl esterase